MAPIVYRLIWTCGSSGGKTKNKKQNKSAILLLIWESGMQFYTAKATQEHTAGLITLQWYASLYENYGDLQGSRQHPKLQYVRNLNDPNLKEKYVDSIKSSYNGQTENGNRKSDTSIQYLVTSGIKIIRKKIDEEKIRTHNRWNTRHVKKEKKKWRKKCNVTAKNRGLCWKEFRTNASVLKRNESTKSVHK